jgi:hypothetical protein
VKEGTSFQPVAAPWACSTAPHPNAAKVFINWFLSRKGQLPYRSWGDRTIRRTRGARYPQDDLPEDARLYPGVKYFDVVKPEYGDMKPIFDLAKEIMQANEGKK